MTTPISFRALFDQAITPETDGSTGRFRAPKDLKTTDADNDRDALSSFLNEYTKTPTTRRAYEKECERLLYWAVLQRGTALSSMARDDFMEYMKFMGKPDGDWCGKKAPRNTPAWRPFTGGLSKSAQLTAIACINSFLSWLVDVGYTSVNPLGSMRQLRKDTVKADTSTKVNRFLDDVMWDSFTKAIEDLPRESSLDEFRYQRAKFMAIMLSMIGPRVSELAAARMNSFRDDGYGWFWKTLGKGSKLADVSVPPDMLDALIAWRRFLGLTTLPSSADMTPLLPAVDKAGTPRLSEFEEGIQPRRINQILDGLFESAAKSIVEKYPDKADKLRRASAHWGRHTAITQKINAGMDKELVRKDARHSDARTTDHYIHDDENARTSEAKKHRLKWSP